MLTAISPVDGRYAAKTETLQEFFSEFALIKYRVQVEIDYFLALCELPLPPLQSIDASHKQKIRNIGVLFSVEDAQQIKAIERRTNHDVKAVEYFLKEQWDTLGLQQYKEFIHFGLTSQDVNNTALPLMLRDGLQKVYFPSLQETLEKLTTMAETWKDIPMLARTHGQPASPTLLGKEFAVFVERLQRQMNLLRQLPHSGKFGGATGNFNAHQVAYPDIDWVDFANQLLKMMGLERQQHTTQIEHYDGMAAIFHGLARINTILIDLCRDIWQYISMDYFSQKTIADEVGSSAMPHKVNPIDFENAEGNLGVANALFQFLAGKLPISRLQRDLTDSTVTRNIGVPFGHSLLALHSLQKGLDKLQLNPDRLKTDLQENWAVVAEAIQTVLRREGYPAPYEALKQFSRGKGKLGPKDFEAFIEQLAISEDLKQELHRIRPDNYTGIPPA